jgi:hypothetical protein
MLTIFLSFYFGPLVVLDGASLPIKGKKKTYKRRNLCHIRNPYKQNVCDMTSNHIKSHHSLHHTRSHHVTAHRTPPHITSHHTTPHHTTPCHTILHHITHPTPLIQTTENRNTERRKARAMNMELARIAAEKGEESVALKHYQQRYSMSCSEVFSTCSIQLLCHLILSPILFPSLQLHVLECSKMF